MASECASSRNSPEGRPRGEAGAGAGAEAEGVSHAHHARSFKLRFAAQREPGRSDVSLVKPLGLPARITGKFYSRAERAEGALAAAELAALARVQDMFRRGPRDKYTYPALSSHDYGWWNEYARPMNPWLRHHIKDSPWMKECLRLLDDQRR